MKKVLFGLAFVAFATVGCKKDYTCECTIDGETTSAEIKDSKKSDAEDACNGLEAAAKIGDPEATCTLK